MSRKEGRPYYKECRQLVQQKKSMMKKMIDVIMMTRTLRYMYTAVWHGASSITLNHLILPVCIIYFVSIMNLVQVSVIFL